MKGKTEKEMNKRKRPAALIPVLIPDGMMDCPESQRGLAGGALLGVGFSP